MKIVFASRAWEDYLYWQRTDRKKLARINELIRQITRTPYEGIGKPEHLRHALAGYLVPTHRRRAPTGLQGRRRQRHDRQARYHY
jgi:Txe/YoeB family toxin of toxin-antitoxin system